MVEEEQSEFKKEVKQWLKAHGLGYSWLAEQCGVSEITVRNWMSQKNIPTLRRQLLERVMVQLPGCVPQAEAPQVPGVSVNAGFTLTVQLSGEIYARLQALAQVEKTSVEAMVAKAISELAAKKSEPVLRSRKVILPTFGAE